MYLSGERSDEIINPSSKLIIALLLVLAIPSFIFGWYWSSKKTISVFSGNLTHFIKSLWVLLCVVLHLPFSFGLWPVIILSNSLVRHGVEYDILISTTDMNKNVIQSKNTLINNFITNTKGTHLLLVNSKISFSWLDVVKMIMNG